MRFICSNAAHHYRNYRHRYCRHNHHHHHLYYFVLFPARLTLSLLCCNHVFILLATSALKSLGSVGVLWSLITQSANEWMHNRMDRHTTPRMNAWIVMIKEEWRNAWLNELVDKCANRYMDVWLDGRLNGWLFHRKTRLQMRQKF